MINNTINNDMTMGGATGAHLAGRYRVVRQLGQGGMGSVWLAEDTKLDGFKVAIKMLPSVLVNNKRAYQQVKAEALVSLKLSHSNIATVRAFEEEGGSPFLVMDYIDGQTLDDYLAEKGKLTEEETIQLLKPIAAALDYAHTQGVVHRDVKPGNIMIRRDGTPFVLDFGIAREIQETMTRVTGKLSSGTLLYMSPEQLSGDAPKPAQDIYSFAAMVYECLKGEPPFTRGGVEDQIKHKAPEPLGPQFIKCGLGVMAGLAKSPESRPASCAEVLEGGMCSVVSIASASKTRVWMVGVLLALVAIVGGASWILKTQKGVKALYGAGPTGDDPVVVTQVVEKVVEKPNSVTSETADPEVEREDLSVERTAVRSDGAKLNLDTRGTGSQKVIVGVMTSLKGVVGKPTGMQKGPSSSKGWVAFTELAKNYEVKSVATDVMKIDANIKVLVVLHAKDLPETTLYAIDQFVLRGGNLIACVDPFSIKDMIASRQQQNQSQGQTSGIDGPSTLGRLFDSWGVKFDTTKVACDFQAATKLNNGQGGIDDNPAFLSLNTNNMFRNDILVTSLSNVMLPFAGAFEFEVKKGRGLVFTPVLTTAKEHSCLIDKMTIQGDCVKNAIPDGHERILVARLSGMFKTAFPNAVNAGADAGRPIIEGASHVILCADSDFLADEFCVRMMKTPFGEIPQLINDNLKFFSNVIDQFAGRENRAGVRPFGTYDHSLGDVNEAEAKAMEAWQRLQTEYEDELEKTQQRLAALQKRKGDNERLVLSKEQQDEILRFRKVQDEIRKKQEIIVTKLHKDEAERRSRKDAAADAEMKRKEEARKAIALFKKGEWQMGLQQAQKADQGDAELQFWLGTCYDMGLGTNCDAQKAVECFRRAAEAGQIDAQCELGRRYESGRGVAKDISQAKRWYQAAAGQGSAVAEHSLRRLYGQDSSALQGTSSAQRRDEREDAARNARDDVQLQELKDEVSKLKSMVRSSREESVRTAVQSSGTRFVPTSDRTRREFDGTPTMTLLKFSSKMARSYYERAAESAREGAHNKAKVKADYEKGRMCGGPEWPELEAWLDWWK